LLEAGDVEDVLPSASPLARVLIGRDRPRR
jgi:hypothetical protein